MKRLAVLLLVGLITTGYSMNEKIIYGYVEKATLVDKELTLSAKLDTGAKSASLDAVDIQEINENGKTYIIFNVPTAHGNIPFKAEYIGRVAIKMRAGERQARIEAIKRPMVRLAVRIGDKERMITVNLTNRKRFLYPLLLGRDAIQLFSGLIDPSLTFTIKSTIPGKV